MRVAVIGGGPAGLTTLKHLLEAHRYFPTEPIEVWLFEKEAQVGGTFRYRTYEDGELVSSRFLTGFSDFRIPDDSPDFISTNAYVKFLEDYCTHFDLWPRIKVGHTVNSIRRHKKGGHVITFTSNDSTNEERWHCDAVAVCSGLHVTPNVPDIKGIEHVPEVIHSSKLKKRSQFGEGKHVMVLGAGETGHDIGYLAITSPTESVTMCHRSGWKNEPKKLPDPIYNGNKKAWADDLARNGIAPPTDTGYASLFDTAYLHPALERSRWLWDYYDRFTWFYAWYTTGAGSGIDQYIGEVYGERHHARKAIAMKSNKTQAYLSAPYRPKEPDLIERLRAFHCTLPPQDTKGRVVDLAPWPEYIDEDGFVNFKNNGRPEYEAMKDVRYKPDVVVYATGYTSVFSFFDESYPTIFDADVHRIWKTGVEDIGFMGFVRPGFGAIPPLAELQAQLWIVNLFNRLPRPIHVSENYLLKRDSGYRLDYIVDHETYAYHLARDMGAAPSMLEVLSYGRIVFLAWALSPNFNPKFRLAGPWKWEGAAEILEGEIWRVIKRRKGFIIWTCMTVFPLCFFGMLSLLYYVAYGVKDVVLWPFLTLGLMRQKAERSLYSTDPKGVKRAEAIRMAHGPEKVLRG